MVDTVSLNRRDGRADRRLRVALRVATRLSLHRHVEARVDRVGSVVAVYDRPAHLIRN